MAIPSRVGIIDMIDKIDEIMEYIIGSFIWHMYDTHGLPYEITKTSLEGRSYWSFLQMVKSKHRDFWKLLIKEGVICEKKLE